MRSSSTLVRYAGHPFPSVIELSKTIVMNWAYLCIVVQIPRAMYFTSTMQCECSPQSYLLRVNFRCMQSTHMRSECSASAVYDSFDRLIPNATRRALQPHAAAEFPCDSIKAYIGVHIDYAGPVKTLASSRLGARGCHGSWRRAWPGLSSPRRIGIIAAMLMLCDGASRRLACLHD